METTKIEPALSAEQWADLLTCIGYIDWGTGIVDVVVNSPAELIAVANAALPDSDPRKITRGKIELLRGLVEFAAGAYDSPALQKETQAEADKAYLVLDALESYLPPV
jgi:hypothetical protein